MGNEIAGAVMVWGPITLMTVTDPVVLAVVGTAFWHFRAHRKVIARFQAARGFVAVQFGLSLIGEADRGHI